MGTHLSTASVKVVADPRLISYRYVPLSTVKETYKILGQSLKYNERLNRNDFEMVAGFWIDDDIDEHFNMWRGDNNFVDTWVFMAGVGCFCEGEFPDKVKFVFNLFDFDSSGKMLLDELTVMNLNCVRGMSLLAGTVNKLDHFLGTAVHSLSKHIYKKRKIELTDPITFDDFKKWIARDKTVMQFIQFYTNETDLRWLSRKKQAQIDQIMKIFMSKSRSSKKRGSRPGTRGSAGTDSRAVSRMGTESRAESRLSTRPGSGGGEGLEVDIGSLSVSAEKYGPLLVKAMFPEEDEPDEEDIQNIISMLEYRGRILAPPLRAMTATIKTFLLVDKLNRGRVGVDEIKALLWLLTEHEPTDERVRFERKQLDPDNTGFVPQGKWINLHQIDPSTTDRKERIFMSDLKRNFDRQDMDRDQRLNVQGMRDFLCDTLKENMGKHHTSADGERYLRGITAGLAAQLYDIYDRAEHELLHWEEFKACIKLVVKKAAVYVDNAFRFQVHKYRKIFKYGKDGTISFDRKEVTRTLAVQINAAVKFGNIHREDGKKFLEEAVSDVMEFEYDPEFEVYGIDPEDTFKTMKRILRRQKKLATLVSRKREELIESKKDKYYSRPNKYD